MLNFFWEPGQVTLTKAWRNIPKTAKVAFFSAFCTGVLVYLFALTNQFFGAGDALNNVITSNNQVWLGRWSTEWLCSLTPDHSMPLVNGMMMILAASLLSAIVVTYLEIRTAFFAVMSGMVLVCYPTVGNMFKYNFVADGYMIAALLAVLSLYLLGRYRFGWVLSVPMLALAMGTYQSNLSLVVALIFTRAVQLILRPTSDNRMLLKLALRYILATVAALAVYYLLIDVFSRMYGLSLTTYQNADNIGQFSLVTLVQNFIGCYRDFKNEITFLSFRSGFYVNGYPNYLFVCLTLGMVGLTYIFNQNKTILKSIMLFVLFLLSPLLLCSIRLANPATVYSLMTYSVVCLYLLGITVLEQLPALLARLGEVVQGKTERILEGGKCMRILICIASWLMILCLIICLYAWSVGINLDYMNAYADYENMYAQCSLYVQMAEKTPGYESNMPIYVLGSAAESQVMSRGSTLLFMPKYYHSFMRSVLGVRMPFNTANEIDAEAYAFAETETFEKMPVYPDTGCSLVINGKLYFKLSEVKR